MSYFARKENSCLHKKQTTDFETREVLCGFCGKVLNKKEGVEENSKSTFYKNRK